MLIKGEFNQNTTQVDTYSFEVCGNNSIHFTLLKGAFEHFFIIVKDPKGSIRALLSYKTRIKQYHLTTSFATTSNNTKAGELLDGNWTIQVVRTYPIKDGYELQIDFDLGLQQQAGQNLLVADFNYIHDDRIGWYHGDFHMHSAYTDGRITHEEIIQAANRKHLDFICMSDHSTFTSKFPISNFPVMPSTEVTWDDEGHYNIHGLKDFPDYASFVLNTKSKHEALDALFTYYHQLGCMLSINHPFPEGWELKHDYDIRNFDTLEVVNAPHLMDEKVDNERAIRFFDYLWNQGLYLFGVGGSDAHKKNYFDTYPIAVPLTKAYCEGLSLNHLLEAAKSGHTYLQIEETFEVNYCRPNDLKTVILPGKFIEGDVELKARCMHVTNWELVKNGDVIVKEKSSVFRHIITVEENEFYRLQARDEEGNIILFVNPIHQMKKQATEFKFQKILEGFYQFERRQHEKN